MEQQLFGVALGAASLLAGYVLHQLSQMRAKQLSYLQNVPQFTDMKNLRSHLSSSPEQKADVLVEGVVKKLGTEALKSEAAGLEGVARLVTTTSYKKVYDPANGKWSEHSSTIENLSISVPFQLVDRSGRSVNVQSVHTAGGFRQILERVWQEKIAPESRSLGDYATSTALLEIPNGFHTKEFLLRFGTPMAVYGMATLQNKSLISSGAVSLSPVEVSSSIQGLIERNEGIVLVFKFLSMVFVVGGGGILLLSAVPLLVKMMGYGREDHDTQDTR